MQLLGWEGFRRGVEFQSVLNNSEKSLWLIDPEKEGYRKHVFVDGFASVDDGPGLVIEYNG